MAEEGQTLSIRDRINAFNVAGTSNHLGRAPVTAKPTNVVVPKRPSIEQRTNSTSAAHDHIGGRSASTIGNEPNAPRRDAVLPPPSNVTRTGERQSSEAQRPAPRLPPRKPSAQQTPTLPPRRPSNDVPQRRSDESSSTGNNPSRATVNRVKAPPYEQANLPNLPQRRDVDRRPSSNNDDAKHTTNGLQGAGKEGATARDFDSTPSVTTTELAPLTDRRPSADGRHVAKPQQPPLPNRSRTSVDVPPAKPQRSALSFGMNKIGNGSQTRSDGHTATAADSPPVPPSSSTSTPPDISKLLATKPKPGQQPSAPSCLLCRDFSAPDAHTAKFPRQQVPSLGWLAAQLTDPFPSQTDKARAIFTWLHHNVAYDTVSFFNNNVRPSTPQSTLQTGLAVCEGYAGLFAAIANKAGMESIVVGGHGKGYGFAALAPGSSVPREDPSGHAWNAVKIDGGYWKLVDCCWGAGVVNGKGQPYTPLFNTNQFTMSNVEFGLRHYPENRSHFFVEADGHSPPTWQEYYIGPLGGQQPLQPYSFAAEEGISDTSFRPLEATISLSEAMRSGPTMRFQFGFKCAHWDPVRNGPGKPYVAFLAIQGIDGRASDHVPFDTDGHVWWLDIEPRKLGCEGQTISAFAANEIGGKDARGWSVNEYKQAKGKKAMSFQGLAAWTLVR